MENVRKRRNVQLVDDEAKLKKLLAQPQLEQFLIVNEDMVVVDRVRSKVKLNKPIYIGFSVLEISKVLIFDFHYNVIYLFIYLIHGKPTNRKVETSVKKVRHSDVMMKRYGTNARLLFSDTDSLCYHIFTEDLYRDMQEYSDLLDTSGYPRDHPLYSAVNKKVMGKMKDECFSKPPLEFVGLRSKMYSLFLYDPKLVKRTAKGIKKKYVKKNLLHDRYLRTLRERKDRTCKVQTVSFARS
jgi:hypothetical protein